MMNQIDFISPSSSKAGKELFLEDLTNGQVVDELVVGMKTVNELKDKNANTYYGIELIDKTGNITGKIWSDSIKNVENDALVEGAVVKVKGIVSEYRGLLQMVIHEVRLCKDGEYDYADILQMTRFDIEEMMSELLEFVNSIGDDSVKRIVQNFLEKYGEEFKYAPAAERLHHAYRGGLLEHVLELLSYMKPMKRFYPLVNFDLVTAGIILHDVGKIRELSMDGFSNNRTDLGKLKGHLIMSYDILHECAPEDLEDIKMTKLEHIILAHHGLLEYGSPVVPKTIEAIMVHSLDTLSSSVRQYNRVIEESKGAEGSFSQKDWALGTDVYLD